MLKRDLKLFFSSLLSSCGLLALLVLVCALASAVIVKSVGEAYTPVRVAIVDNEDSVLSRILVRAVGQTEQISSLLSTVRMDGEAAGGALERGECAAVIILPEGFIDDIIRLREAKGTIVLSDEMASQISVVRAAASFGERLLAAGQYAIFCGEEVLRGHDADRGAYEALYENANAVLLTEAARANEKYIRTQTLDYMSTGLKSGSYFALWWTVALLFLCSVFFMPLILSDSTKALLSRVHTLGVGIFAFVKWKIGLLWLFRAMLLAIAAAAMIPAGIMVPDTYTVLCIILASLYITLIGVCLTLCFDNGITANIIFAVSGLFLCGGIVPRQLLPDIITKIGDLTPFGAAGAILAPAFGAAIDIPALVGAVVYSAAAFAMIMFRLERIRAGWGDEL